MTAFGLLALSMAACGPDPAPTARPGPSAAAPSGSAAGSGSVAPGARSGDKPAPRASATPAAAKPGTGPACRLTEVKQALVVGKLGSVPITTAASPTSTLVGVGFVSEPTKAIGFALDPGTLQARVSYTKPGNSPIRTVVPYPVGDSLAFATDLDDPKAMQKTPVTLPSMPPVTVRSFKQAITVASGAEADPEVAWMLPSDKPVLTIVGAASPSKGAMVAVRTEDALRIGWLSGEGKPMGTLFDLSDPGKPANALGAAMNGQTGLVLVRPAPDASSPVKLARAAFGSAPGPLAAWTLPAGGPGGEWSLPSVSGLADGRWVFVWAEGKKGGRQLRMQTYDAELRPIGAPVVAGDGKEFLGGAAAVGASSGVLVLRAAEGGWDKVSAIGLDCS
jgi:hypothetical protein